MKAGLVFTGSGALLVLTRCESFRDSEFVEALKAKGIHKFIAFHVPMEMAKEKYGLHFDITLKDSKETDDLRILDEEGRHAFYSFPMETLGDMVCYEEGIHLRKAA